MELFEKNEEVKRQGELLRGLEHREHEPSWPRRTGSLTKSGFGRRSAWRKSSSKALPDRAARVPGFEIWGTSYPAEETGGDYFDYIERHRLDIDIVIADVSGHGYGPALIMASTRAYLRALAIGAR